jgi:hypothetical protein
MKHLLMTTALLAAAAGARAEDLVTVAWSAKAATVVKKPFGLTIPLNTVITGYFTFDLDTPDENPSAFDGEYQHNGDSGFLAEILSSRVTGSGDAFYWVDRTQNFSQDTFRIYDGPRAVGFEGGTMSFDGVPDEDIEMFLAVTEEDVFASDALINPFPFYTFGLLGTPHTFSLEDEQGTVLLQFLSAVVEVECGDPTGGGVTAADALKVLRGSVGTSTCYPCACDVDANGTTAASDALKVLRFAVSGSPVLHCSVCS